MTATALAAVAWATGLFTTAALAAGIAVLTKSEPGLSSSGTPIWHCSYIVENRETTVTLDTACPASLDVR